MADADLNLWKAAREGDLAAIETISLAGAPLDGLDASGGSALEAAYGAGNTRAAMALTAAWMSRGGSALGLVNAIAQAKARALGPERARMDAERLLADQIEGMALAGMAIKAPAAAWLSGRRAGGFGAGPKRSAA